MVQGALREDGPWVRLQLCRRPWGFHLVADAVKINDADYNCGKFHMGRLGANLGSVVKGEEDGAVLLPIGALRDYGNPGVAGAVGGITLLLEYVKEVIPCVFSSTTEGQGSRMIAETNA